MKYNFAETYQLFDYYLRMAEENANKGDEYHVTKSRQFRFLARLLERILKEMAEEGVM
jgi:hypothetical protein